MSGDDDKGGERTVMASAEELAAALAQSAPPPTADPFAAPPPTADPFGAAGYESTPPAQDFHAPPPAIEDLPEPQTAAPAVPSFGHGPPGGLVGYQLNDLFEIVRFIARGGMGEVYEGRNLASGERVAIKVILPQFAADAQFMALFRREASSLERLGHDALVKYRTLAFDRTSQLNYLAIEYVDGPPMSDVLDGNPADADTIRAVLARLAAGLAAAHEAGVIHRDLSPDNVLLPGGDLRRAKIIDFGIAKDTNPGEKSVVGSAFAGKFGYAAPEIFGKYGREVGPWTDVYSLALVVIALARGRALDMGITIVDALEARGSVPDLSYLPPELIPVFTAMLQPDPAQRLRTMPDVLAMLGEGAGMTQFGTRPPAQPAFVRADAIPPPSVEKPKIGIGLYAGIGGVAVLLLAGGGYLAFGGSKPAPAPVPDQTIASAPAAVAPAAVAPVVAAPVAWDVAKPQIEAALAAMPCSDVRIASEPSGGSVRLTGWHPSGTTIPALVAGYRLEAGDAATVPQPSSQTCDLLRQITAAVPARSTDFTLKPVQHIAYTGLRTDAQGNFPVDLGTSPTPTGKPKLLLVNIDDQPASAAARTVSGRPEDGIRLSAISFERKAARMLIAVIAGPAMSRPAGFVFDPSGLTKSCSGNRCVMATGWVTVTP